MSSTTSATDRELHFPSQREITDYLKRHPLTNDQERGVNEAIAELFANSTTVLMGVEVGVTLTMSKLNEKLGLPRETMTVVSMNLTQALQDCANGKEIQASLQVLLHKL